jgi:Glycosyl transferase family 2
MVIDDSTTWYPFRAVFRKGWLVTAETQVECSISVVIPTYQRKPVVSDAVDSALAQTVRPVEVLVVDDGSTDATADTVMSKYGDTVRVVRRPNRGPAAARNSALAMVTGDAVAFLDSDDRWKRDHLALLAELLTRHPHAVLVGTNRQYQWGRETPGEGDALDYAELLILGRVGVGHLSSVAVRREELIAVGGFDERLWYGEDVDLFVRLALISADTFERDNSLDSLQVQGQRSGGYVGLPEHIGGSALSALKTCARPDVERLQTAARARQALGRALRELDASREPSRVRTHLEEAFRLASTLGESIEWDEMFLWGIESRGSPQYRAEMLAALARAWPAPRSPAGARLRFHTLAAAVRARRWVSAARLAQVLGTPSGASAAIHFVRRRTRDALSAARPLSRS